MNLRVILPMLSVCAAALLSPASASNVFVLPPSAQSGTGLVFGELLANGGSFAAPAGIHTTVVSPAGTKAAFLSSSATSPVTFVTLANGQVSGIARTLQLDGLGATAGVLSPDGQLLMVIGGADPGKLFIIDLAAESVVSYGRVTLSTTSVGTPKDLIVTHDSKYAVVLSTGGARITAVDLQNGSLLVQTPLSGVLANNISISPTGAIFVTGNYELIEFQPGPPFAKVGRSRFYGSPGKLFYSPSGRYAFAANEQASSSFFIFDSTIPGENDTSEPISMGVLNSLPISIDGSVAKPTRFYFRSDSQVMVYFGQQGRFYSVNFPNISSIETNFNWVSTLHGATGATLSDEYPSGKNLFYTTPGGQLTRLDLSGILQPSSALAVFGTVYFGKAASTATPASILPYGVGQTVAPATVLKPYAVRVLDASGRPVFNASVIFTPGGSNVGVSVTEARTNLEGIAIVTATAPNSNGDFSVTVNAGGLSADLTSKVEGADPGGGGGGGTGGTVRAEKVSGDGQLVAIFFDTKPLVIRVLDAEDKPIVGREVTWSTQSGVSLQSPKSTVTDADGFATMNLWRASDPPLLGVAYITYLISATVNDIGTVTFVETGYLAASGGSSQRPVAQIVKPTIDQASMTMQLGSVTPDAFRVHVVHPGGVGIINNTPIPNVGITVTSINQNPAAGPVAKCQEDVALTDATGIASCTLVVTGILGTTQLVVDVGGGFVQFGGGSGIPYTLTVTPGGATTPVVVSGNNQKGKPGELLPINLTIEVSDGFGNMLGGLPVSWVPQTSGSVALTNTSLVTATNGRASTQVRLGPTAGTFDINVTVGGQQVVFKVTVESQLAGFAKIAGDNQTGIMTNQVFPTPLSVKVSDTMGQPVAGVAVTFAVTGGSALLGATTAITASTGLASVTVTAGPVAGNITVNATISNFNPLVFSLSSRLPGPSITAESFRNYSTNISGIAPGLLVRISGNGVATGVNGEYWASMLGARLPTEMRGVKVEFTWAGGSGFAPIMAVSNDGKDEWVLIQVPYELTGTTASALVTVSGGSTTVNNIPVHALMPGVIEDFFEDNRRAAIIVRSDGLVVTPATPARKGETVRMYVIGLGQTTPLAETNRVGTKDQMVSLVVQVGLETGKAATVTEAKMAENLIGIYEIFFTIPEDAPVGPSLAIACSVGGVWSNESKISISAAQL